MPSSTTLAPRQRSWRWKTQTYVQHTITLTDPDQQHTKTTISCLVQPSLLPSLPTELPAHPEAYPNPIRGPEQPNHAVLPTVYKGLGLFATRDISAGSLIAIEHPALIVPCLPWGALPKDAYDSLADATDEGGSEPLVPERRADLMNMANSHVRPQETPEDSEKERELDDEKRDWCESYVEGIIRTNALTLHLPKVSKTQTRRSRKVQDGDDEEEEEVVYGGVYPLLNRCNHSCGPNAAVKWSNETFAGSLYALHDIKSGEEIFKTYVDPTLPRSKRMEILQQNHHFQCDCPWCSVQSTVGGAGGAGGEDDTAEPELAILSRIAQSDSNRAEIRDWLFTHPGYTKWSTDLCRSDNAVIDTHLEALAIIAQEGLHGFRILFVEELAMCYAMLGDEEEFKRWGRMVVQLSRVEDGMLAMKFEEWLVDPRKRVKKWGWRTKERQRMSTRKIPSTQDQLFDLDLFATAVYA